MEEYGLEQFLAIYEALTPENRARLVELLEAFVRNQEASADSLQSEIETKY